MSNNPKPCRFCDYDREDSPTILEVSLDAGVLGRIEAGLNFYLVPPQIAKKKGWPAAEMSVWMWHETAEGKEGQGLGEDKLEIQYCPFCGRRIGSGE